MEQTFKKMYFDKWKKKPLQVTTLYVNKIATVISKEYLTLLSAFGLIGLAVMSKRRTINHFRLLVAVMGLTGLVLAEPLLSAPFAFYLGNLVAVIQVLSILILVHLNFNELLELSNMRIGTRQILLQNKIRQRFEKVN
jgi:hypothetical protein